MLGSDSRVWNWLDHPTQIRLENLVKGKVPADRVQMLVHCMSVPQMAAVVETKFTALDDLKKERFIAACPAPFGIDDAIRLFGESGSFRSAEARAQNLIIPVAQFMTPDHIRRVLAVAADNTQIWDAADVPESLQQFFGLTKEHLNETKDAWRAFLGTVESLRESEHWTTIRQQIPA